MNDLTQAVFRIILSPDTLCDYDDVTISKVLRVYRAEGMLGILGTEKNKKALNGTIFHKHILSASRYSERQASQVRQEVSYICNNLKEAGIGVIVLKGAAYNLAGDLNAIGRLMSDLDILVKASVLEQTEQVLKSAGWVEKELDDYDQNYYRAWSHELPPYYNPSTGATLDIHHTLLPVTTKKFFNVESLFKIQETYFGLGTLCLEERLIHCIVHFSYNEDYGNAFRDLWDLHCLIDEVQQKKGSILSLLEFDSARQFHRDIAYVLYLNETYFKAKYDDETGAFIRKNLNGIRSQIIKNLFKLAVVPNHDLTTLFGSKFARVMLALRGHLLKMPFSLFIYHIAMKSYRGFIKSIYGRYHYE